MNRNNAKETQSETLSKVVDDIRLNDDGYEGSGEQSTIAKSVGTLLRDARLIKKLSPQDVSKHLRISVKQVEALEDDNFALLPESVIVRGFIRNYARMLEVDAEPILDIYRAHVPETLMQSFRVQSSINRPIVSKDKQPWAKYAVASALVIGGLVAWLLYVDLIAAPIKLKLVASNAVSKATIPVTASVPEALPEIALPVAERAAEAEQTPPVASEIKLSTSNEISHAAPLATSVALPKPTAETVPATPVTNAPVSTASNQVAKFNFSVTEKTWLNLIDANGKVVYSKTLEAGAEDALQVDANALPVKVIVGNVSGTTFNFNGNAVDLASYAKSNVAKFSLK